MFFFRRNFSTIYIAVFLMSTPESNPAVGQQASSLGNLSDRLSIMDFCSADQVAKDITSCAQAAIEAAGSKATLSYGGKVIFLPAQYSPYRLRGSLHLAGFVGLEGEGTQTSYIECENPAAACIVIGRDSGPQQRDQSIENLGIWESGEPGATAIRIFNTYNVRIERVDLENVIRGIDIGSNTNSITLRDVNIVVDQAKSDYGIYWHAPGDNSSRSDVVVLDNVTIVGRWSNATGIMWDGLANTLEASHVRTLQLNYGLRVTNSAHSSSYYPAFLNAEDFECEGAKVRCISIEGGNEFKFSDSDFTNSDGRRTQGGKDDYAIGIFADSAASVTRGIQIANSRIGISRLSGLYTEARDVQLSNVQFVSTSLMGPERAPVIRIAASSQDVLLTNIRCEEFGGRGFASNCVQIDNGAKRVQAIAIDAQYVRGSTLINSR